MPMMLIIKTMQLESKSSKTFVHRSRSRLSCELLIVHKFYINSILTDIRNTQLNLSLQKIFDKKFQLLTSADKK